MLSKVYYRRYRLINISISQFQLITVISLAIFLQTCMAILSPNNFWLGTNKGLLPLSYPSKMHVQIQSKNNKDYLPWHTWLWSLYLNNFWLGTGSILAISSNIKSVHCIWLKLFNTGRFLLSNFLVIKWGSCKENNVIKINNIVNAKKYMCKLSVAFLILESWSWFLRILTQCRI